MKEITSNNLLLLNFETYLNSEEKSILTIRKYVSDISRFIEYLTINKILFDDITKQDSINYKDLLLTKNYAPSSVNSIIASLNCFFTFLERPDLKLRMLKLQRKAFCSETKELTKAEYMRLISTAEEMRNKRISLIIQTICGTGIRISELSFITVEAARTGEAIVSLKGKTRTVFIVKKLQKKLLTYCKKHNIIAGSIFITKSGNPINRSNVWREMKALCKKANICPQKVFPHNLRHLFAKTFYNASKDIAKLADILGHSSINTTMIYLTTTSSEHRRRMESMNLVI